MIVSSRWPAWIRATWNARDAVDRRGHSYPLIGAVLVLGWARWSRTPWREIGYVRPKSWSGGLAIGLAFDLRSMLMKVIVMPMLGADPINPTYH